MKVILKGIYSLTNKIIVLLKSSNISVAGSTLFRVKCNVSHGNMAHFKNCNLDKTRLSVKGKQNELVSKNAFISNTTIQIEGTNNKLILEDGVKLRSSTIIMRGSNCLVHIQENTTFGGVRIVNVGENNSINIGKGCLFADHIEIWASDTHSIYNAAGEMINKERPIRIGNNVWVGSHTFILKGVSIENDSVVGMGTKVTKDIPSNTISVGSPNTVIKEGVTWDINY